MSYTFANQSYNEQNTCFHTLTGPVALLNGGFSASAVSSATYVTLNVDSPELSSEASVIYEPNITATGNYTILLYTPGCLQDGTCATRGGMNVTVDPGHAQDPFSLTLFQTNYYDKYDEVYTGYVDAISGGFQPRITVTPPKDQPVPFTFVADRIQVILNAVVQNTSISSLFEYSASNFSQFLNGSTSSIPVGNTTVNGAGPLLGKSAIVKALYASNDTLYAGGNFSQSDISSNLVKIGDSVSAVSDKQFDGYVNGIQNYSSDEVLVYGNFQLDTGGGSNNSLSNIALYSTTENKWTGAGHGTDGEVTGVSLFALNGTETFGFSGKFSQVFTNASKPISVEDGFCLWVASENSWFPDSSLASMFLQARISHSVFLNSTMFYTGYARLFSSSSSGAATVNADLTLSPVPFKFGNASTSSNSGVSKRDGEDSSDTTPNENVINAGTFANSSLSILGGHFIAEANNLTYNNLIMINDGVVSGLPNGTLDHRSEFHSLHVRDGILYAGGAITGDLGGSSSVSGLVLYDLATSSYSSTQPPAISGGRATIHSLQMKPNTAELVVVGSFNKAGDLSCTSFCVFDLDQNQWSSPASGVSGTITSMRFTGNDDVVLAGNFALNGSAVYLAQYNFATEAYSTFGDLSTGMPGPVSSFALLANDFSSVFVAGTDRSTGSAYLTHWDGRKWNHIDSEIEPGSVIADLSLLDVETKHAGNDLFSPTQVLLVSGNINLKGFGNASSIFFDGSTWQPAFLTTKADGSSGAVNSFYSQQVLSFAPAKPKRYMDRGFVVLVSLAVSLGLIFLMVALGLLALHLYKLLRGYRPAPKHDAEASVEKPAQQRRPIDQQPPSKQQQTNTNKQ